MEKITEQEKKQAIKAFEEQQKRQYKKGKIIIFVIATVNIITSLLLALTDFNMIALIINISLSIALYSGVTWVRYFFAICATISTFLMLLTISMIGLDVYIPIYIKLIVVAHLAYCIVSSIVLFTSKSVKEFLYSQKNG